MTEGILKEHVTLHSVSVNDHLVCASTSEAVSLCVLKVCEGIGNRFPAYQDALGRCRYGIVAPYIAAGSFRTEEVLPKVRYHVTQCVAGEPTTETLWVNTTETITDALEELVRAIRENLKITI